MHFRDRVIGVHGTAFPQSRPSPNGDGIPQQTRVTDVCRPGRRRWMYRRRVLRARTVVLWCHGPRRGVVDADQTLDPPNHAMTTHTRESDRHWSRFSTRTRVRLLRFFRTGVVEGVIGNTTRTIRTRRRLVTRIYVYLVFTLVDWQCRVRKRNAAATIVNTFVTDCRYSLVMLLRIVGCHTKLQNICIGWEQVEEVRVDVQN